MRKFFGVLFVLTMCLGMVGCSAKSLESDIGKENATVIESAINELAGVSPEYKNGDKEKMSGTYTSGDCEFTIFTDGKTVTKIDVKDNKPDGDASSQDFKDVMNEVTMLTSLDLDYDTMAKSVELYNAKKDAEKNINGYIFKVTKTSISISNKTEESLQAAIPITIEDIEMVGFKCLPPDSIGTIYMETKFKNNSDLVVKSIKYTYSFDDDKTYLTCYDTLKPGETSTKEDTFGPKSRNLKDAQLLKASFTVVVDGEDVYVDYDAKLKQYEW